MQQLKKEVMAPFGRRLPFVVIAAITLTVAGVGRGAEPLNATNLPKFTFFPQGGTLWRDLFPMNFVDLDPGSGIRDWNGTNYTYDGHDAVDAVIRGWEYQDIGVSIFAVLDGMVVDAHDGEFDQQTEQVMPPPTPLPLSNYVVIDHGGGLTTTYVHMRRGSVAVQKGDSVRAGQQIGLTASSGWSSAPHLHFAVRLNNVTIEPFAGVGRPGDSLWANQAAFRPEPFALQFYFTGDYPLNSNPLFKFSRIGTYVLGTASFRFRTTFSNLPASASARFRFLRPDNTSRAEFVYPFNNAQPLRWPTWAFLYDTTLDRVGRWHLEVSLGNDVFLLAPFDVVASATEVRNRPPNAVAVAFDGDKVDTANPVVCRIQNWTPLEDPDYDVVRFRWVWRKNNTTIRDVVTAGTADVLMRGLVATGDTLSCTVTPSDGRMDGPAAMAAATVVAGAVVVVNPPRLVNLSVLTSLSAPGDTFTLGYVVGGKGTTGDKPVVVRAAGPSLGVLGVSGALGDPKIELFAGSTKTGENDNWGGVTALANAMADVGAFAYSGPNSRDAAAAFSVAGPNNSVRVSGVGSATGNVIAEIYDATPANAFTAATPRLVNVSVLKHLGTGLTAGFVIGGVGGKTVLIRAIGPGLAAFGVSGTVPDPRLELFDGAAKSIAVNDNWGGTAALSAAFSAVGAFALAPASSDAALVATLQPGNYTVQVSGVGGVSGIALVEVYEVP